MPTVLQFRRGTTAQNNSFTGSAGELSIDTTIDTIRVHDGSTAGGFELTQNTATQTLTNKTLTSPVLNTSVSGTAVLDEDDMSSNSATQLATQQSIKAYVDSQVTAQDLDFQGDSGGTLSIDLDSEVLDIAGGTGIDTSGSANTLTVSIDSTVTTLTGSQTLTNKTLTSPTITGTGSIAGTFTGDSTGDVTGNADTATTATNVTVADESSDTTCFPLFVTAATGNLGAKSGSNLTFNSSTGVLAATTFSGSGASLTALNGSNITTGTVAAARVATLNQNTTGTAGGLSSAVTVQLSGDVTGSATFTSAGDTASITTTIAANSVALGTDTTGNYVGTITGGTGIASSGATTGEGVAHTLSVDLSELTDMTATMTGTDEFIVLDAGADRRKAANEIGLSIFNNDAGFTTNVGDITNVAVSGTGLSGGGASGSVTITSNATNANTGSTIVARDASGNFSAGVITATATQARYADLAEKYTSDQDYEPGTIVELGGEYEVTQTRRARSTAIAGIVSTDPAYLMNSDSDGISVALIGRVPCKVIGQVRKGDMLISSDEPGHAQAYKDIHNPPTGSVIGKAIENKDDDGTGVIEVLVGRL